jgi:hypothetical protein
MKWMVKLINRVARRLSLFSLTDRIIFSFMTCILNQALMKLYLIHNEISQFKIKCDKICNRWRCVTVERKCLKSHLTVIF